MAWARRLFQANPEITGACQHWSRPPCRLPRPVRDPPHCAFFSWFVPNQKISASAVPSSVQTGDRERSGSSANPSVLSFKPGGRAGGPGVRVYRGLASIFNSFAPLPDASSSSGHGRAYHDGRASARAVSGAAIDDAPVPPQWWSATSAWQHAAAAALGGCSAPATTDGHGSAATAAPVRLLLFCCFCFIFVSFFLCVRRFLLLSFC